MGIPPKDWEGSVGANKEHKYAKENNKIKEVHITICKNRGCGKDNLIRGSRGGE